MNALWAGVVLLSALSGVLLLWVTRIKSGATQRGNEIQRRAQNIGAFRERLRELEAAGAAARIGDVEFESERARIERMLLAETDAGLRIRKPSTVWNALPFVTAIAVPLLAIGLYGFVGAVDRVELDGRLRELNQSLSETDRRGRVAALLPLLERIAVKQDPDGAYRYLLARLYWSEARNAQAASEFEQLVAMYPSDASLIAQAARARYAAEDNRITPPVQSLIDRGFALDPNQPTLLGMIGMERFQAGDFAAAVSNWQRLLDQLPPNAPDREIIGEGIRLARSRLGVNAPETGAAPGPGVNPTAASLRVELSLAPDLRPRLDATVFVFARAVNGPPMPLAVARLRVSDLPRAVELTDAMAMAPGLKLSAFREVDVAARVSQSGNVAPAPGDMEASAVRVALPASISPVALVIDHVIGTDAAAAPR